MSRRDLTIAMNLSWLQPGRVGGTETYAVRVIDALKAAAPDVGLEVFAAPAALVAHTERLESLACHALPAIANRRAGRIAIERTWLRRAMNRTDVDVEHHLGGTVPFPGPRPTVVTVHDLQPLAQPENFGRLKREWLARALPQAIDRADVVATPSHWVAATIIDRFGVDPTRVRTVSAYALPPAVEPDPPTAVVASILERGPALLYPAMTMAHKNHETLFRAFAIAVERRPDLQLVCVGAVGRDHAVINSAAAQASSRIYMLGHVSGADLAALMASAELLVFPSRHEGFGLPVLEAQRASLPVAASTATAIPEVAGTGAVLLDPDDVDAWAEVLATDLPESRRKALVEAGHANVKRYSPDACAVAQIEAYRLAVERASSS